MVSKCNACAKFASTTGVAICFACKGINHKECVGFKQKDTVPSGWLCPDCCLKVPKCNTDDTPVKSLQSNLKVKTISKEAPCLAALESTTVDLAGAHPTAEIRQHREEMREIRVMFIDIKKTLSDLTALVSGCEARLEKLEARVDELEQRRCECVDGKGMDPTVQALEYTVAQLRADLNDRDQDLLLADVEVTGIPEESGENLEHLVSTVAVKLGVTLDERDVVSCARAGGARRGASGDGSGRPRPIVVRFARRAVRQEMLRAARVRRRITTEGLGLKSDTRPFHVNERLTKANRRLFYEARESAKRGGWRYVWTRDGRILVRRAQGDPVHRIRAAEDLERVFGRDYVRADNDTSTNNTIK